MTIQETNIFMLRLQSIEVVPQKQTQKYVPLSKYISRKLPDSASKPLEIINFDGKNREIDFNIFTQEDHVKVESEKPTPRLEMEKEVSIGDFLPYQKRDSRSKTNKLFLFSKNTESQDKMSFGHFMDSFEQQKEEIVKEWLKKNDVDLLEDTNQFNDNSDEFQMGQK